MNQLNRIKVFFCTDGIFPHSIGGMQRHSRLLIEHLAGFDELELVVIHPHGKKIFPETLNVQEIFVTEIDTTRNYLLECYRYSGRVYDVVKQHPDSIVYAQGLSIWKNMRKLPQPLIVNPHGLEPYQAISFREKLMAIPFKMVFNRIFKTATLTVSLGGMLTEIIRGRVSDKKIVVLPNAVEMPLKNGVEKEFGTDRLNLLFVARFAHNKGIDVLMRAIVELNDEGWQNKLEFNLGGKGPLFGYYTSKHKYENVHYLGFVSDEQLAELYRNADVFVFPTLFEGMPTVVLEAMSAGLPVIVSNVGATAELVDQSNGFLIEKNSVPALKKAILDFYNMSTAEKKKRSQMSVSKVEEHYNWNAVAKRYLAVFIKLSADRKADA